MFNQLSVNNLSPNQFYLLCCMSDSIGPLQINLNQELRALKEKGIWVDENDKLTPKAISLIQKIDAFFRLGKRKTGSQLMGVDFDTNIKKYLEIFPKIKLPSGKPARCAEKNLETNFRWFFENHQYSWEIILEATARYVDEYERKNWLYMRTSQYFIRKKEEGNNFASELANYCAIVIDGTLMEEGPHFTEKVV